MPRKTLEKFTELPQFDLHSDSVRMLPLAFCSRNQVVVLGEVDLGSPDPIHLGMLEPGRDDLVRALAARWARPVVPIQLNQYEINKALDVGFGTGVARSSEEGLILDLGKRVPDAGSHPVELLDDILLRAVANAASDVHIECYAGDIDVRLRVDGVLHQLTTHLSPENIAQIVSRVKILGGLDIAEHRRPQDGRFRATVVDGERRNPVDFRVSVLPGPFGEDVVLRVLDSRVRELAIEQLGMSDELCRQFRRLLTNPEGTVLVTGPTGSGKTTTLYSALAVLDDGSRKILTAEDPIELYLPKINQKQVSAQLTMADLTRAFLRHDPDVLLIGEVRDEETAIVAARAAATGHLVLGTLHTSDSIGAVPRLRSLGLGDHEIADSLLLVISQRLARRICRHCSEPATVSADDSELFGPLIDGIEPRRGAGCKRCHQSGCAGRTGIFEFLLVDETLQGRIVDGLSTNQLRRAARRASHPTLVEDGLDKVRRGVISLDELARILPYRQIAGAVRAAKRG